MPTILQSPLEGFLNIFRNREWDWDFMVFGSYLLTAKLAQYILFNLHTSPALLWAPSGIALAAVLLKGYRLWLPIACAYLVAVLTLPGHAPVISVLFAAVGFTLQPLLGAWGLTKLRSNGTIHRARDVIVLVGGSFIIAAIGPLFSTYVGLVNNIFSENAWLTFSRAWAGGVLGIVIVTPFITGWYYSPNWPFRRTQLTEALCALGFLFLSVYLLFWTTLPQSLVFLLIFFLCAVLFWISFRFGSRVNTTGLLFLTVFGIAGSIIGSPGPTPLNQQLFADELFIILIAPIFLLFFALMEERRVAERNLAAKVAELEDLTVQLSSNDKAKNEFIAILAHELRNPLSTLVSTLELLKLESTDPGIVSTIERGEQQTQAMRRLLDDLLDVARIAEKKFSVVREPVELETIIKYCAHASEHIMLARRHSFTVSLPPEPVTLLVDPVRIEQVITNLLNNAAKYTSPGGMIQLSCSVDKTTVRIEVRDNGRGIAQKNLEKIFSPFQQLNPAPHRTSGIGVGLFITRQIIEMHEGSIRAYSEGENAGSRFTVFLPLYTPARPSAHKKIRQSKQAALGKKKRSILIIDDNEVMAMGLSKLLNHKGYETAVAHTGAAGIKTFNSLTPGIVLLDIGLPDMSGYEVAEHIRTAGPEGAAAILIAITGYGQETDKENTLTAGFNHHLVKPVGIADIEEVLSKLT